MMNCANDKSILAEMDATLDQLIANAKTIQGISLKNLQSHEIEALQKTQESLLAHLIHLDDLLNQDRKKKYEPSASLKEKAVHYHQLNAQMMKQVMGNFGIRKKKKGQLKTR